MSREIEIIEVGPRDGLQNEKALLSPESKVRFIEALVEAGAETIEVGAFVSPRWVPAMANTDEVFRQLRRVEGRRYLALVPNLKGYARALEVGCDAIALFAAASEGFSKANLNASISEALQRFGEVAEAGRADKVAMRAYVSTIFACPIDGPTAPEAVRKVVERLLDMGAYEVSLGDTTGVGTPADVERLLSYLLKTIPASSLAMHFHDTWGMGAANSLRAVQMGIRTFDASAGGLGGCPYARSATGNVATEDLIYLFEGMGYETGYALEGVVSAARALVPELGHDLTSRVNKAFG